MKPGQTYAEWVAELRGIARNCLFVCQKMPGCQESYVDYEIRDMIVKHTPDDSIRTGALQKLNPTLDEVMEIAQAYECTIASKKEIKGEEE